MGKPTKAPQQFDRTMFTFSRGAEYFDAHELQVMTGQPLRRFIDIVVKELSDNAFDAAEASPDRPAPKVRISVRTGARWIRLVIADNGAGLARESVERVCDFNTRSSDKVGYRSPTRGAQGNALKTILGMPFALGARPHGFVIIESLGVRHKIRAWLDQARQVRLLRQERPVRLRPGTRICVYLPNRSEVVENADFWAEAFALYNPHATVRFLELERRGKQAKRSLVLSRKTYRPSVPFPVSGGWRKFLPTDPTSAWWYDADALAALVCYHTAAAQAGGRDLELAEFARQFKGMSVRGRVAGVCRRFPDVRRLSDLTGREAQIPVLLGALRSAAGNAPAPSVLGVVGEEHLRRCFHKWFGVRRDRWWYSKVEGLVDGTPFVVEAALAETRVPGELFHGINFSPTFEDPFAGTILTGKVGHAELAEFGAENFLKRCHIHPRRATEEDEGLPDVAVAVHLVCPGLQFLDKGKTRLSIDPRVARAVGKALGTVSKHIYREEEKRRKDAASLERRRGRVLSSGKLNLIQATDRVMLSAVRKASGDEYQVSAHTLFYVVRDMIQPLTSRELRSDYFEQDLLPAYQQAHGLVLLPDGRPAIYYEPRGTLFEPHDGTELRLGTREVAAYKFPFWLYDKILFIEKQGLWPVFQRARLGERYDMAVVAGEGFATEACRHLLERADKRRDYQILVLHDADPYGYNICRTLREETDRMPGYSVEVHDLGLRIAEALDLGLTTEKFTRSRALPQGLTLTDRELELFTGAQKTWGKRPTFVADRVELNAFVAPDLLAYTESRMRACGIRGKVIPPADVMAGELREELRRMGTERVTKAVLAAANIEGQVEAALAALAGPIAAAEARLPDAVREALQAQQDSPWRAPVRQLAEELVDQFPRYKTS
jgi:DNA topoisomerase VI subunit B